MEKRQIEKRKKGLRIRKHADAEIALRSAKTTLRFIANVAYILMFLNITIISILNTTMYKELEIFSDMAEVNPLLWQLTDSPYTILLIVVIIQYLCSDEYNWKEYILSAVLMMIVCFCPDRFGIEDVRNYVLLILGARKFSFRRLLQTYVVILFGFIFLTVLGAHQGWVENLLYTAREGRNSYGFVYPTDCAAHFLFAALCYWVLRKDKLHYIEAMGFGALGMVTWYGCKARFSTVLLVLLGITACVYRFLLKRLGEERQNKLFFGYVSKLLVLMPLLCNLGIHILSMAYSPQKKWMVWFNTVVNTRLSLVKRGIDLYGFRLWGSNIPMNGNGGTTAKQIKYYYIDSSFMQVSLLQGILVLAVLLFLFSLACLKARQNKEWVLLIVLVFVALHALFEHHAFDPAYSPLLISAFAVLQPEIKKKRKTGKWIHRNRED